MVGVCVRAGVYLKIWSVPGNKAWYLGHIFKDQFFYICAKYYFEWECSLIDWEVLKIERTIHRGLIINQNILIKEWKYQKNPLNEHKQTLIE